MKRITIAAAALGLLVNTSAQCQKARSGNPGLVPATEGLMLNAHSVVASGITLQGPGMRGQIKTNTGGGLGIQVGWGFSSRFLVFVSADAARQSTSYANVGGSMALGHLEAGGRMAFAQPGKRAVPYVMALIGTRALAAHSDGGGVSATIRFSGSELGAGGGLLYAFSSSMALDASLSAVRGKLGRVVLSGDVSSDGSVDINSSTNLRLRVGFSWHPSARSARS